MPYLKIKCTKFDFSGGRSAHDPTGGDYRTPLDPMGSTFKREEERQEEGSVGEKERTASIPIPSGRSLRPVKHRGIC